MASRVGSMGTSAMRNDLTGKIIGKGERRAQTYGAAATMKNQAKSMLKKSGGKLSTGEAERIIRRKNTKQIKAMKASRGKY